MPRLSRRKLRNFTAVFILSGAFLFSFLLGETASAVADINIYNKDAGGTLQAVDWNNLLKYTNGVAEGDFVNTWLPAKMNGPLSINNVATTSTTTKLWVGGNVVVDGSIFATNFGGSFTGSLNAANVTSGIFGSNYGGGNYSFSGKLGIGVLSPNKQLHIYSDSSDNAEINIQSISGTNNHWGIYHDRTSGDLRFWNNNITGTFEKNLLTLQGTAAGNVGIGTTTPLAKLDINGSLRWGGGKVITSSDNITTFPSHLLVNKWDNTQNVFRLYVNGTAGNDSNNGLKLSTSFREIQKAVDQLPSDLQGYEVYILVTEGTYAPVDISRLFNGSVYFEWVGTGIKAGTVSAFKTWALQGEPGSITTNGPAQIISPDTRVAFNRLNDVGKISVYFYALERLDGAGGNDNWMRNYGARWRFGATGQAEWLIRFWSANSVFTAPQFQLDLGNAAGGVVADSNFETYNVKVYGGAGSASIAPAWSWKTPISLIGFSTVASQTLGAWCGYVSGEEMMTGNAAGSYLYFQDVRDAINTGGRPNPSLTMARTYEGGNRLKYVQVSSIFSKANIISDVNFQGLIAKNDTYFNFVDNSTSYHRVIDTNNSGKIYTVIGDSLYDNQGNIGVGTTVPTANLQVAQGTTGVGTVSVSAGGTAWTGVGTQFLNTFKVGDTITSEGQTLTIATITTNTALTTNAVGAAISGKAYTLAGGTRFSVLGNGNVGIGTTAPLSKLSLFGGDFEMEHNKSIKVSSPSTTTTLLIGNYADGGGFVYGTSTSPLRYPASLAVEGDVKADRLCIEEDCKAAWSEIVFSGGGGQWMTTGNNISNTNLGNVGIGTTNPLDKLNVSGEQISVSQNIVSGSTYNWLSLRSNRAVDDYDGLNGEYAKIYLQSTTGDHRSGDVRIALKTAGSSALSDALTIKTGGNVGIGTTNPLYKLDVNGSPHFNNWAYGLTPGSSMSDALATVEYVNAVVAGTSSLPTVGYWTKSGNNIYSSNSGNVGIGTTNPMGKLDVQDGTGTQTAGDLLVNASSHIVYIGQLDTIEDNTSLIVRDRLGNVKLTVPGAQGSHISMATVGAGNVGIGTTNPIYGKLQITDSGTYTDGLTLYAGSGNIATSYLKSDGASDFNWHLTRGGSDTLGIVIKANGNVGIGTTTPTSTLHVAGGTSRSLYMGLGRIGGLDLTPLYPDEAVPLGYLTSNYSSTSSSLWSGTKNGNIWNGTSGVGNVGIGTSTPGYKLHVIGDVYVPQDTGSVVVGDSKILSIYDASWGQYYGNVTFKPTSGNKDMVFRFMPSGTADSGVMEFYNDRNDIPNNNYSRVYFKSFSDRFEISNDATTWNGAVRMPIIIDANGGNGVDQLYLSTGDNVGIGTTNPIGISANGFTQNANSRGLELRGGSNAGYSNLYLRSFGGTIGLDVTVDPVTSGTVYLDSRYSGGGAPAGGFLFRTQTNGTAVNALSILYGGNVGIGKTNPALPLDVNGGASFSGNISASGGTFGILAGSGARIVMSDNSGNIYATSSSIATGLPSATTAGQTLRADGANWLANSVLFNNGTNVGIGTTNPLAPLHIFRSTGVNPQFIIENTATYRAAKFIFDTGSASGYGTGDYSLNIVNTQGNNGDFGVRAGNSGNVQFILKGASGNVGIGTTTPSELLDVYGMITTAGKAGISIADYSNRYPTIGFNAGANGSYVAGRTGAQGLFQFDTSSGTLGYYNDSSTPAGSGMSAAGRFIIDINGNVGISKTSPTTTLDVVGGANFTGTVNGTGLCINGDCKVSWGGVGATSGWTVSGNDIYKNPTAGNVGIGTTAPVQKLEVSGTFKATASSSSIILDENGNFLVGI